MYYRPTPCRSTFENVQTRKVAERVRGSKSSPSPGGPEFFSGKKEGYCFGICKDGAQGLGYYLDTGGEEMHEDVRKQLLEFQALPPLPKQLNDTSGELTAGLDEVRVASYLQ